MIVMPLFGDQFDNAQRIDELGLGARVNPYDFTNEFLTETVDRLLYDNQLKEKLEKASERILSSNKHEELAVKIEQMLSAKK